MLWRMPVKGRCEPCFPKRLREKKKVMEMSKTKRYLSILLSLVLLCTTVIPMSVFAADEGAYPLEIYAGDTLIWSGETDKSLGYVHLNVKPVPASEITIRLKGSSTEDDAFGQIVEVAAPVLQENLKERLQMIFDTMLHVNQKAREACSDGDYRHVVPQSGEELLNSQEYFYQEAYEKAGKV